MTCVAQAAKQAEDKKKRDAEALANQGAEGGDGGRGDGQGKDGKARQKRMRGLNDEVTAADLPIMRNIAKFPQHRRITVSSCHAKDVEGLVLQGIPQILRAGKKGFLKARGAPRTHRNVDIVVIGVGFRV